MGLRRLPQFPENSAQVLDLFVIYRSAVIAIYGQGAEKPSLNSVIKRILTFPAFICLLAALALGSVPLKE